MRHGIDGRKLGRNTPHRKAMFRNLANSVLLEEQVLTTSAKAKEARRVVEKLITLGKAGTPHAQRLAFGRSRDKQVVQKLFGELSERYSKREGGYTRIVKLSQRRRGDGAEMALFELVDHPPIERKKPAPVEGENAAEAPAAMEEGAPADPFARFQRMFGGSKKKNRASKKK